jgi:tubby-related protein 1
MTAALPHAGQSRSSADSMLWYVNKKPQWNEQVGAFVLNFGGRVTVASVKNFQLVSPEASHETEVLRFGKRAADEFALDFRSPLSPLVAFCIALSSFEHR